MKIGSWEADPVNKTLKWPDLNYDYQTWDSGVQAIEYRRIREDGAMIWVRDTVSVIYEKDKPRWLRGMMVDIINSENVVTATFAIYYNKIKMPDE